MIALAGQLAFSASTSRRRASARLAVGVLSLALALGSPLCHAALSAAPFAHDSLIDSLSLDRGPGQSLGVGRTNDKDDVCCHLLAMREHATGKSPALLPHRTSTSPLSAPSLLAWVYRIPLAHTMRSLHRVSLLATPLERFTDKLVL